MSTLSPSFDDLLSDMTMATLQAGFLDDAKDRLDTLDGLLARFRGGEALADVVVAAIRREAHTLKGNGESFGFPFITLAAHRLEDYLRDITAFGAGPLADTQCFVDLMQAVVEDKVDPGEARTKQMLLTLPAKPALARWEAAGVGAGGREVLLVCASRLLRRAVAGELALQGCRVATTRWTAEAIRLVMLSRPDLIIASAVMEGISGIDLARACSAMRVTHDIPFALLTSLPPDHRELSGLPAHVTVIRHDVDLLGGVAAALDRAGARRGASG